MLTFETCYNLEEHFVYATDCQVATLSGMLNKKTSKGELERQFKITDNMVRVIENILAQQKSGPSRIEKAIQSVRTRFEATRVDYLNLHVTRWPKG